MLNGLHLNGPSFLASVMTAGEAEIALDHGADIIDAKDPTRGALGALPQPSIRAIVAAVHGRAPVSATIGDLPSDAAMMVAAAQGIAATGVDFVKAGFFEGGLFESRAPSGAIAALGAAGLSRARLIGVLMADLQPDFELIIAMAKAGFAGVMLDTANKADGGLLDAMPARRIAEFIQLARAHHLMAGLAGSLRAADIAPLKKFSPDVLGFRGALCSSGGRTGALDAARVRSIATEIKAAGPLSSGLSRSTTIERPAP